MSKRLNHEVNFKYHSECKRKRFGKGSESSTGSWRKKTGIRKVQKTKEQESGQELVFQEKNNKLPVSLQAIFIYKEAQGCG